jgi:UDP-2,4-diacetamido-2,4,6-trideoxy-beta-L-altropyranose hydrolase
MLSYRVITWDDIDLIYDWNNDPVARNNSFHSNQISKEEHEQWFNEKLHNPSIFYLIAVYNNQAIALVRYDVKELETTVGINLSKSYRGLGLSSIILTESSKLYFSKYDKPLIAYIKKENIASKKTFEKAGYTFQKEVEINQFHTLVYIKSHKL